MARSEEIYSQSKRFIPGGVNSPVRAFRAVGGTPIVMQSGQGCYLSDADGNRYIDLVNGWGPMILGHAHPEVVQAITRQIADSTCFGTATELELSMARLVCQQVPGIDKVRMVNSGTEACMSAVRLARGFTGRNKVIKFRGCYHGHYDGFLVDAGSGALTLGRPSSAGVQEGVVQDTLPANYNDLDSVRHWFAQAADEIAAVIVEPVCGNMGCIPPGQGFLEGLRTLCDQHGALLVFDEVMTGFRLAFGGAQEYYGVTADLVCFGKIIGGGMPVGAFGGKGDIMDFLAPEGPVYQAGTLSGNSFSMAAGLATLQVLHQSPTLYQALHTSGAQLQDGLVSILTEKGIDHRVNRVGSMLSVFFTDQFVIDLTTARTTDAGLYARFFWHMVDAGVYLPPSNFETWFVSMAIGESEADAILRGVETF